MQFNPRSFPDVDRIPSQALCLLEIKVVLDTKREQNSAANDCYNVIAYVSNYFKNEIEAERTPVW
jgi:hypothetical protein